MAFTFREDGWFNMTKAAKHFGKDIKDFFDNKSTTEYMDELSRLIGGNGPVKETKRGNWNLPGVGTWGHPKLAVFFARWLDVRFAVWCDAVIEDILTKKAELVITKPQESALMALPQNFSEALRALADR